MGYNLEELGIKRVEVGKDLHDYGVQPFLGSTFALKIISPQIRVKTTFCLVSKSFLIPDIELYKVNQADNINILLLNKPQYSDNSERVFEGFICKWVNLEKS